MKPLNLISREPVSETPVATSESSSLRFFFCRILLLPKLVSVREGSSEKQNKYICVCIYTRMHTHTSTCIHKIRDLRNCLIRLWGLTGLKFVGQAEISPLTTIIRSRNRTFTNTPRNSLLACFPSSRQS